MFLARATLSSDASGSTSSALPWPPNNISWLETTVRGGGEVIRCQKLQFSDFPNSVYLTVLSVSPV